MIFKKASINKGVTVLLAIIVLLGIVFIVYQQKIITSLKEALTSASSETIKVDLGPLEEKLKSGKGTLVVVGKEKDAIMLELAEIKAKLKETQELLNQAQSENKILKEDNSVLKAKIEGLEDEIRLWEGKIKNLDEKKLVLRKRTQSIRELNKRVWDLKVKAQKEIDAIKLKLGNLGFLTKDGKTTFSREKTVQLEKIIVTHPR